MASKYKEWAGKLKGSQDSKRYQYWIEECKKIQARFNNIDYEENKSSTKISSMKYGYNLLWSNFKTIMPYLCPYIPNVLVDRADNDKNYPALTASEIIQRCIQKTLELADFKSEMYRVKTDYILYGRGVLWNRYEAIMGEIEKTEVIVDDAGLEIEQIVVDKEGKPVMEDIFESELVSIEYVNREDILTNNARTWKEVEWVAKRSYMNKKDFKEKFSEVDFDLYVQDDKESKKDKSVSKKAEVWEIWDKENKEVIWFSFSSDTKNIPDDVLDSEEDFLGLKDFYPCPEFILSTVDNESIIPTPDYSEVRSQYEILDTLTNKLYKLMKMLKVTGLYAGAKKDIPDLLADGSENVLKAVSNYSELMATGGLKGAIEWFPVDMIIKVMISTIEAMDKVNSDIQRLLGIPNIMEGQTNAQESWKTNQSKGRYGTMRIQERQDKIQTLIKRECEIVGEIIGEHFEDETLVKMSGIMRTPNKEYIKEAIELLRNEEKRDFEIDIETEGTKGYYDEQQAMQSLTFFNSSIDAMVKAQQVVSSNSATFNLMKTYLLDLARQFRKGKNFESTLESTLNDIEKQLEQPQQPPQPSPDKVLDNKTKIETAQIKSKTDIDKENIKQNNENQRKIQDGNIEGKKNESGVIENDKDRAFEAQMSDIDRTMEEADLLIKDKKVDGDLLIKNKELEMESAFNLINLNENENLDTNLGG